MKFSHRSRKLLFPILCATAFLFGAPKIRAQAGPGPEHQILKKLEGEWTAKIKAGGDESAGTVTYKMTLEGLWLESHFRGSVGGQLFEGKGLDSYDAAKRKYVSVWVDSMSARPLLSEGSYDETKKTLTMTGEGMGPDGNPAKYKMVTRMPDPDHFKFTMFLLGAGEETPMLTIDYTRKK